MTAVLWRSSVRSRRSMPGLDSSAPPAPPCACMTRGQRARSQRHVLCCAVLQTRPDAAPPWTPIRALACGGTPAVSHEPRSHHHHNTVLQ